jgi:hypothetical protein
MYIYAFSNYTEVVVEALSNKKALLTKKFNRADNFINLTLLGAQKCVGDRVLDKQSSIYMCSRNGNINTTLKVLDAIFIKKRLPMPFNFLNSVNAAMLFFVAKNFEIEGKTLFVARFESALPQAYVDVTQGKTVLLGVVKEAIGDLKLHQRRFETEKIEERSSWLVLSSEIKGQKPLAQIYDLKLDTTTQAQSLVGDFFNFLEKGQGIFEFQGENLSYKCKTID